MPFIANSVGWYIAEAGRQPWIVVGLQKTAEAVSPNLTSGEVWLTLIGFTAIYLLLAVVAVFTAIMFIRRTKILICGEKNSANKIPAVKNAVSKFKNAFEIFIFIIYTEKFFKIITKKIITDKNFQKKSRPKSRNKFFSLRFANFVYEVAQV